ncbi:MAG: hypothetical protein LBE86_15215 [Gemmobacter sp.]|jgi:hypothetical protein|nr:hypothetical protein [Gemmobacter sp.]
MLHVDLAGRPLNANADLTPFLGEAAVVKIRNPAWEDVPGAPAKKIFRISKSALLGAIREATGSEAVPARLLVSCDPMPLDASGNHDPDHILVLDYEAAAFVGAEPQFRLYGTSWISSDFEPGSRERPVHKSLLRNGYIFEMLDLANVASGVYFMVALPIPLIGASEAPVCPVLFAPGELPG